MRNEGQPPRSLNQAGVAKNVQPPSRDLGGASVMREGIRDLPLKQGADPWGIGGSIGINNPLRHGRARGDNPWSEIGDEMGPPRKTRRLSIDSWACASVGETSDTGAVAAYVQACQRGSFAKATVGQ